jgi:hypothetical protein
MNESDSSNRKKGKIFEQFIIEKIFNYNDYDVLHESSLFDKPYFVHSNLNPDYKLRCKKTKQEFWIECKFNSIQITKNIINVKSRQYYRFKNIKEPVFYVYGFGLKPDEITQILIIPINKMYSKRIFYKRLFNC